jgi:hypothetical protein
VYRALRDEIVEFLGQHAYDVVVEFLERAQSVPVPHPAVRRG